MSEPIFPIINLPNTIEIQQAATTNQIEIIQTHDDPIKKKVSSLIKISQNPYAHNWYTVWEGEAYDEIGQWTDDQLATAIVTLVTGEYPIALIRT